MSSVEAGSGLEVRLLGPFEAAVAGRTIHIGSPKQRAVLALLALQAGKVVPSDALCELVWEKDPPASPSATLQSLISRLRATLAAAFGGPAVLNHDVLRTREPGWVLDVDPSAVDALRFRTLTGQARLRSGQGEAVLAAADLAEAVGLWRGSALVDVVDAGYLTSQAVRLDEARLDAVEDLAEAELAIGHPAEALALLEGHVEANALRERGWGLLMVALYRLGRQAAALRAFQHVRAILREELGLEPSPELADIEQRILRHDPALASPAPPGAAAAGVVLTPDRASPAPAREALGYPSAASSGRPPVPEAAGEFADYSVVVVEDHDFQRRTVVRLLRGLGVGTVTDASNGAEAMQLLQTGPAPDVIICDIDMPGMDGIEFVTRVSESNLACAIVIASGLGNEILRAVESIGESHGLRVLAALQKPLTARRLAEVLRTYTRLTQDGTSGHDLADVSGEALRDALVGDELTAQFSPRIDLSTGAVSSVEAEGRWRGLDGSSIPASLFVPALAREGLLLSFVERLVAESCVVLDEMSGASLGGQDPIRVAVDVSLLQLADVSLTRRLTEMVQSRGQDPRHFVYELDEAVLARAPAPALEVLTRLRVKGFGLSMRHCGTGPSWTHSLGRVPLSELKLDRRLVTAATADPKRMVILESALGSARDLDLAAVADGCDSSVDFEALLALGCPEAQGRFVAEPMGRDDLLAWASAGPGPQGAS